VGAVAAGVGARVTAAALGIPGAASEDPRASR
jgi:hypothetical protein